MPNYDLTSLNQTNTNSFLDAITVVNTNSNQVFGVLLLVTVFFGYFFLFSKEQKMVDLLTSSFLTMLIGFLLLFIGLIGFEVIFALIVLFVGLALLYWWTN